MGDYLRAKVGDKVRVKETSLDSFQLSIRQKLKDGRIGVVTSIGSDFWGMRPTRPSVMFYACGRKKEYDADQLHINDLELVEESS